MTEQRNLQDILKLNGAEGAAARLAHVQGLIRRAEFTSNVSHYLALELIEKAVERFDDSFAPHMTIVRDFFGAFWQKISERAREVAWRANREAEASHAAAEAFRVERPQTQELIAALHDPTKTPTIPEFLVKLRELKEIFEDSPAMIKLWREVLDEKFGKAF